MYGAWTSDPGLTVIYFQTSFPEGRPPRLPYGCFAEENIACTPCSELLPWQQGMGITTANTLDII